MYWLYEHMLKRQITVMPGHVCFMISGRDMADAPENLYLATAWCNEISAFVAKHNASGLPLIRGLTFHIATPSPDDMKKCLSEIRKIGTIARLILHVGDKEEVIGEGMDCLLYTSDAADE